MSYKENKKIKQFAQVAIATMLTVISCEDLEVHPWGLNAVLS